MVTGHWAGNPVGVLAAHLVVLARCSRTGKAAVVLRSTRRVVEVDLADGPGFDELLRRVRSEVGERVGAVVEHPDVDLVFGDDDRVDLVGLIARAHAGRLMTVLQAVASDSRSPVGLLPMLTEEERRHVTGVLAHGPAPTWTEATIPALLQRQARIRPTSVALELGDERVTHAELDDRAERLARRLVDRGVRPGDLVGICLPREPSVVVAMLGVLKAGAAYVPLDPAHPPQRIADLLADARPSIVVSDERWRKSLPATGYVLIDGSSPDDAPAVGLPEVSPRDLAYVIFTSGSTGRPKGVLVEHRGVTNLMRAIRAPYDLGPDTRILQFAATTFDASVLEILPALAAGGTVVFVPADVAAAGPELLDFLRERRITSAHLPPSLLAELPEHDLPELTHLYTGAEACSADAAARWSRGRQRFVHCYGPTEASVLASVSTTTTPGKPPPIGRPLAGVEILVLDGGGEPVPVGVVGEIHIGGAGVARGYLGRSDLTAERFVPHPLTGAADAPMYRTGDLGRWNADGELEFAGRLDGQVKVRGHRVEPGEVETVVTAAPGVRSCAVVAQGEGSSGRLVAFVVLDEGVGVTEVRDHVAARLPAYLVPSVFVPVAALPTTVHHKVDRAALRCWQVTDRPEHLPYTPAEPGTESALAEIWAEVLAIRPVGRFDDLIGLGGTSLQAVAVAARTAQRCGGTRVPVGLLLGRSTLAEVAAVVAALPSVPDPVRVTTTSTVSPAQQRIWFVCQFGAVAGVAYNEPAALRVVGELDTAALRAAVNDVVTRHPSLRTVFSLRGGELRASAVDRVDVLVPVVEAADWTAALDAARAVAATPFDLATGPLVRASVFRTSPQEHLVLLVQHHLVCDGVSIDVIDRDLATAYAARVAGRKPSWGPAPSTAGYLDWLAGRDRSTTDRETAEWLAVLDGAPTAVDLPTDRPRPARASHRGGKVSRPVPVESWRAAQVLARSAHVTPYVVHLAAFGLVLSELTGQRDFLVGSSSAGRPTPETEQVVGFFANTMVLRLRVDPDTSVREFLAVTARMAAAALDHQYVPFEQLVAGLVTDRDPSRPPLIQTFFAYHGAQRTRAAFAGTTVTPVLVDRGAAKLELVVEVEETSTGPTVTAEFASDLFDEATVIGWLDRYLDRLARLVGDPAGPTTDLLRD
ncbi:amino acid adenylation domain-containing protein [Lentzea albida]|uniref:Amino acid adenylation domain-containing protein n=1 Tax=Lentzea albida TaxID=65499 RepID=A0A1H9C1Z6_9PSEU|nr:amino acid adenylation domain-containing protein [Lentzea albida]